MVLAEIAVLSLLGSCVYLAWLVREAWKEIDELKEENDALYEAACREKQRADHLELMHTEMEFTHFCDRIRGNAS